MTEDRGGNNIENTVYNEAVGENDDKLEEKEENKTIEESKGKLELSIYSSCIWSSQFKYVFSEKFKNTTANIEYWLDDDIDFSI